MLYIAAATAPHRDAWQAWARAALTLLVADADGRLRDPF